MSYTCMQEKKMQNFWNAIDEISGNANKGNNV